MSISSSHSSSSKKSSSSHPFGGPLSSLSHKQLPSSSSHPAAVGNNNNDENDDDETASVHSSTTTTSSTHESSIASSIDDVKLKLLQMKRANNKKLPQSKLLMKFKNFITPEQRAKNELNKRIEHGIRSCLMYHSPVELSSICGVLGLKSLERANVSIELILQYCKGSQDPAEGGSLESLYSDPEDYNENKVLKVVNSMWEGALYEYLKSIGHPLITSIHDPKQTVMKVWRHGGFHSLDASAFTPHYIQKRVVTRHDDEQSEDITIRQLKLKELEKVIKYTERELFEEHNYTNALMFFQQLGEIRRLETEFRDYLIYQLELIRGEMSRMKSNVQLSHEMVQEIEERYLKGVSELNEKLSVTEIAYEDEIQQKFQLISQIQTMNENITELSSSILPSHYQILKNSSSSPLEIYDMYRGYLSSSASRPRILPREAIHRYNQHLQNIYHKIHQNTTQQIQINEQLTYQVSSQQKNILTCQSKIQNLKMKIQQKNQVIDELKQQILHRNHEIQQAARDITYMNVIHSGVRKEAWDRTIQLTGKVHHFEEKLHSIAMIMKTGIQITSNQLLTSFIKGINNILEIVPQVEMKELYELGLMREEDRRSEMMREDELRMALISGGTKVKKKKVVKKGGGSKKSSGGKKAAAGATSGKKSTSATGGATKKATKGTGKETKKGNGTAKKKK